MPTPRNRTISTTFPGKTVRSYYRNQEGWNGDHKSVYGYRGQTSFSRGGNGCYGNQSNYADAANSPSVVEFMVYQGIPPWSQLAYNKAYARFKEDVLGDQAGLGETFAEWKQNLNLITSSAVALTRSYRAARKGNWKRAADELGGNDDYRRQNRSAARKTADTATKWWLANAFGIQPTIGDIRQALEELSAPLPYGKAKGTCQTQFDEDKNPYGYGRYVRKCRLKHRISADVLLVNPNVFLLNQVGLLNPLSLAWELIPFSFMIDWLFKVGDYLASFSDWVGLELRKACSSSFIRYNDQYTLTGNPNCSGTNETFGYALIRRESIPSPIPVRQFNGNLDTFLNRAASAVSILIQTLI